MFGFQCFSLLRFIQFFIVVQLLFFVCAPLNAGATESATDSNTHSSNSSEDNSVDTNSIDANKDNADQKNTDVIASDLTEPNAANSKVESADQSSLNTVVTATSSAQTDEWYIGINGTTTGPFSRLQIQQMIFSRSVIQRTLVQRVGSNSWLEAQRVFDFSTVAEVLWTVNQNGVSTGPFTEALILKKIKNRVILPHALLQKQGTNQWLNANTVFPFPKSIQGNNATHPDRLGYGVQNDQMNSETAEYLEARANSVRSANIIAAVGMLGTVVGVGLQISGISADNQQRYYVGMGIGVGFGIMRFGGVIASGVAATKFSNKLGKKKFGWGLFAGGLVFGTTGQLVSIIGSNRSNPNLSLVYAGAIAGQITLNLLWIGHCVRAANLTEDHRTSAKKKSKLSYGVVPTIDPVSKYYGLSVVAQY